MWDGVICILFSGVTVVQYICVSGGTWNVLFIKVPHNDERVWVLLFWVCTVISQLFAHNWCMLLVGCRQSPERTRKTPALRCFPCSLVQHCFLLAKDAVDKCFHIGVGRLCQCCYISTPNFNWYKRTIQSLTFSMMILHHDSLWTAGVPADVMCSLKWFSAASFPWSTK